jgi:phosphatidate cytidylyltransferase
VKLGNLAARVATAVVLVPPLILAIYWHRHEAWWAIVFAASGIALHEYFNMALKDRDSVERWVGIVLGLGAAALVYWRPWGAFVVLPAVVILPALYYLFRFQDIPSVAARMGMMTFGLIYAGLLLTFITLQKRDLPGGWKWVILTLMIAWLSDTGAYFAGRFLGKKKLYPAVSPGKTWAGAFGGLAGAFGGAVICNLWFFPELGWVRGAVLTVVGGALGQCGDLVESLLKRSCGVKDSGKLLPGHGGMLDRVDAILFVAPWVFLYAQLGPK